MMLSKQSKRIWIKKQVSVNTSYEVWTGILSQRHLSFTRSVQDTCSSQHHTPLSIQLGVVVQNERCIFVHLVEVSQ